MMKTRIRFSRDLSGVNLLLFGVLFCVAVICWTGPDHYIFVEGFCRISPQSPLLQFRNFPPQTKRWHPKSRYTTSDPTTTQRDKTILSAGFWSLFSPKENEDVNANEKVPKKESDPLNNQEQASPAEIDIATMPFSGGFIEFSWHTSIVDIPAASWDSCLGPPLKDETKDTTTIDAQQYRRSPFLEHAWMRCLEDSGCASEETGWTPRHLSMRVHPSRVNQKSDSGIEDNNISTIDGCVPAYIKTHSRGEFIFDNAWADAAFRNGIDYYPKLLLGVPFTPVTGSRILWHPRLWDTFSHDEMEEMTIVVGDFLKQSALRGIPLNDEALCSSVHINFCTDKEATALAGPLDVTPIQFNVKKNGDDLSSDSQKSSVSTVSDDDHDVDAFEAMLRQLERNENDSYLRRVSIQYHWNNRHPRENGRLFRDFTDYLSCFRSKRRISIKRERAKARDDGKIQIDTIRGGDILKVEGLVERMYEVYVSTVDKLYWGRQYLSLDFFQRLCQTSFIHNLCFMCARNVPENEAAAPILRAEDVFAGTFNVVKDGVFYGRYWGCLPGYEMKNLHFEVCYWSAIDFCIENGLRRMEPGAGGGDYKWARGFDPQLVHSVHFVCDSWLRGAVRQFLESEIEYNVAVRQHLLDKSSVAIRDDP